MKVDRTGERYGMLVVTEWSHSQYRSPRMGSYQYWKCQCDCGNVSIVLANNLVNGNTKSCGCQSSRVTLKNRITTHGMSHSPTYKSWSAMKDRCYGKSHSEYKRYGALGIVVCDRWKNSFENFVADMGCRPQSMSLERKDPKGNYEPSNCKWADAYEQANNKRGSVLISCFGKQQTLSQWSREVGIKLGTLYGRIKLGWNIERALTIKPRGQQ